MIKKSYHILVPVEHVSEEKTIVVLGCPRGGTSLIAGLLYRFGIFMGDNLKKQYEDKTFKNRTYVEYKQNIERRNNEYKVWGWKLPNTIYYIASITPLLRNPYFIIVYRDPFSIACSSAAHDGRELDQRLLNVPINHYQKMHTAVKTINRTGPYPQMVCSYEGVLKEKINFVQALADFCGLELTEEKIENCISFIDPKKGYQSP
jgi:hypothetical protein